VFRRLLEILSVLATVSFAFAVMGKLRAAGVDSQFFELKSDLGHSASGQDAAKWAPVLRVFMDRIAGQR
jgi:hypothetical protein